MLQIHSTHGQFLYRHLSLDQFLSKLFLDQLRYKLLGLLARKKTKGSMDQGGDAGGRAGRVHIGRVQEQSNSRGLAVFQLLDGIVGELSAFHRVHVRHNPESRTLKLKTVF